MKLKLLIILIICFLGLDLRAEASDLSRMQTCYFRTGDYDKVIGKIVNTLQDSDFVIQDINREIGFLSAQKSFKSHYVNKKRVAGWSTVLALTTAYTVFSYGATAYSMYEPTRRIAGEMKDKTVIVDANVVITPIGKNLTKVRISFVGKIMQNADGFSFVKSAPMRVFRVYNPDVYEEFFEQVSKNSF